MKTSASTITTLIFAASTAYFAYKYFSITTLSPIMADCACKDDARYGDEITGGGHTITKDAAQLLFNEFATASLPVFNQYGSWISKHALDTMFCENPTANGLFLLGAATKDEATGKYNLHILVKADHRKETKIRFTAGEDFFITEMMECPTICAGLTASE